MIITSDKKWCWLVEDVWSCNGIAANCSWLLTAPFVRAIHHSNFLMLLFRHASLTGYHHVSCESSAPDFVIIGSSDLIIAALISSNICFSHSLMSGQWSRCRTIYGVSVVTGGHSETLKCSVWVSRHAVIERFVWRISVAIVKAGGYFL